MPPITTALITLNLLVYALATLTEPYVVLAFGLWPPGSGASFHYWQLFTYSFLHGSLLHLAMNMGALAVFGPPLERRWGDLRFLLTYLLSVVVAAMTQVAVSGWLMQAKAPIVGASGGVFGLLLAFALYFPNRSITLFFLPQLAVPARRFVFGYAALELLLGVTQTRAGVAHFAHLGGLFGGWLAVQYFRGRGLFAVRK